MSDRIDRNGRLFMEPAPDKGAHPGARGPLAIMPCGVVVNTDCEWLVVVDDGTEWPMGEWSPVEKNAIVPWHRVDMVEWDDDDQ